MTYRLCSCVAIAGLMLCATSVAQAQERRAPAVDVGSAWMGFADDTVVSEMAIGSALRWYVSPRVALGPEVLYIQGDNHSHLALTGNLTWDLLAAARSGRVTPFLVIGGGMFQTRETFFTGDFTSTEGALTAGGGVRAYLGKRVSAGVDVRAGWEPHVRVGAFVGIVLGRPF